MCAFYNDDQIHEKVTSRVVEALLLSCRHHALVFNNQLKFM